MKQERQVVIVVHVSTINRVNTIRNVVLNTIDGGPSRKTHIGPLNRVMAKRMEEEEGVQKTLFLWRINF